MAVRKTEQPAAESEAGPWIRLLLITVTALLAAAAVIPLALSN
jgi:hypothetical protein